MSLDWPTAWDQNAWGAVLSALAFVAAVVAAVLAGGARRAAREQRTGFRRARLLRALEACRSAVDAAGRAADRDLASGDLGRALADWNSLAIDVSGQLFEGCGLDAERQERLLHALDAVGRERSLVLVWLDVGATADPGPVRAALQEARRQLDGARIEIERRTDR